MSLPYFPMYPSDFEAKTSHLTLAEDGAYNRLLRITWMTSGCTIPDDDAWIMRRLRCSKDEFAAVVRVVIDEYFIIKKGRLINKKLLEIYLETSVAHKKRVVAGSKGGKAKALNSKGKVPSNAVAMPKQPEPEPELYKRDTKVSTKKRAEQFPEDWMPSEKAIQSCRKKGYVDSQIGPMVEDCINHHRGKGNTFKDFNAAFRMWASNQIKFHGDPHIQLSKQMNGGHNGNGTNGITSNRQAANTERLRRIITAAAEGTSTQDWATD